MQVPERRDQVVHDAFRAGDVHCGREGVVGRLAHIDVVVRMDWLLGAHDASEQLDRPVGDDLVRVHVRLRAGAGLPDDEREMIVEFAVDHFLRRADDGFADGRVQSSERHVGFGCRLFDDAEGPYDGQRLLFPADLEIAEGTLGLCAPIAVVLNLDRAECICFRAGGCHRLFPASSDAAPSSAARSSEPAATRPGRAEVFCGLGAARL